MFGSNMDKPNLWVKIVQLTIFDLNMSFAGIERDKLHPLYTQLPNCLLYIVIIMIITLMRSLADLTQQLP